MFEAIFRDIEKDAGSPVSDATHAAYETAMGSQRTARLYIDSARRASTPSAA